MPNVTGIRASVPDPWKELDELGPGELTQTYRTSAKNFPLLSSPKTLW